ncbi:hypothetical protein USB125703_01498 [Pseudoclavibacter triregionum]|nr:hypothetical protein USB125703_01498 [Pseudoclavibacter triregionum]
MFNHDRDDRSAEMAARQGAETQHAGDETVAPLPPRFADEAQLTHDPKGIERILNRVLSVQRPLVVRQIRGLRAKHPDATPAELARIIEKQYLNSVTATGGAAGAAAVVPGIGTAASIGLTGVETVGFLEMTALYGQSIAEIHGLHTTDPMRARTLVMSLMLGETGRQLIGQFTGQVTGKGGKREAFWGEIVTKNMPAAMMGPLSERIRKAFVKRFIPRRGAGAIGRLIPFGIGAVIGGAGNRILAGKVIEASHEAFGPAPALFPVDLQLTAKPKDEKGGFLFFAPILGRKHKELEAGEGDR